MNTLNAMLTMASIIGGGASLIAIGRTIALYYEDHKRKLVLMFTTTLIAHITLGLTAINIPPIWTYLALGVFVMIALIFLCFPGVGKISKSTTMPYLLVNLVMGGTYLLTFV